MNIDQPDLTEPGERDAGIFSIDGFEFVENVFIASFTFVAFGATRVLQERIDFRGLPISHPSQPLLRLLALACSLSYYKATSANRIVVRFSITESEQLFLTKLIQNGLAEFAYRNNLFEKLSPSISTVDLRQDTDPESVSWQLLGRPVVAVGGGKDSVVTIETLKKSGLDPILFYVNRFDPIEKCVEVSDCDYVRVIRVIDPQLRILNEQGANNGHVPVTAIISLIGLVVADLGGFGPLVMSNEWSANFGSLEWQGLEVNHQWSKSLAFEDLLRATLADCGLQSDRYFSLLRPFREIEIAEQFARYSKYFSAFTSCNRVFKIDSAMRSSSWCGECPKCQFVFLILAPFIPKTELVEFFGRDVLGNADNIAAYEEIIGIRGNKPFECVGEYDEAAEAFLRLSQNPEWNSGPVVTALIEPSRRVLVEGGAPGFRDDRVPEPYLEALSGVILRAV